MSIFDKAINDIFAHQDFIEQATINGEVIDVVCSKMADAGISYVETGAEFPVSFTLDVVLPCRTLPRINDKVVFRGGHYKVADLQIDSANTSLKIYLIDTSRGIG